MRTEQNKQVMLTPAAQVSMCARKGLLLLPLWDITKQTLALKLTRAALSEKWREISSTVLGSSAGTVGPHLNASPETQSKQTAHRS